MRLLVLLVLLGTFLNAHKLNMFLYEEDDKIKLNSYFASGTPCKSCEVKIYDEKQNLLEKAKTDKEGNYSFEKLSKKLTVKVEALGGHATKSEIEIKSLAKQKEEKQVNTTLQSLIAAFLIAFIFLGLKRFRRE